MKKVDMRIVVTKRLLLEALIKLLNEKTVNEITIKELTETAGVNRGSFYQHYKSIDDLVNESIDNFIEECFNSTKNSTEELSYERHKEAMKKTYDYIYQNKEFMKVMYKSFGSYALNSKIKNSIKPYFINRFKVALNQEISEIQLEYLFNYIYGGCIQLLDEWLSDNPSISFEGFKRSCSILTRQILKDFVIEKINIEKFY